MAASHIDLVQALAHDKGNVSTSLKGLEHKGLVTITWTPGGEPKRWTWPARGKTGSPR
jgi:DNA-binding transcriptional regulator GbsR (MarR family)